MGFFLFYEVFTNKEIIMKKIIKLTESDLTRIVKRVIMESSSKIELFQDKGLTKSIGFYTLGVKDSGMGRSYITLNSTPNSKIKCLYSIGYKLSSEPNSFTPSSPAGCWTPSLLFTNNTGKNLIKNFQA